MAASSPMVTQDTPYLQSPDCVLDVGTSTAMTAPRGIAHDAASAKGRRDALRNATVATIGEHAPVPLTQHLDLRTTVVDWIVAIAWAARNARDDLEISTTQDLCIARVTVVLGFRRMRMVPRRNQGSVDDPRPASVTTTQLGDERSKFGCDRRDDPVRHRLRDLEHRG